MHLGDPSLHANSKTMAAIGKFIEIRNVARIRAYSATGDVSFRRVNLVYGQNGQGKTSLTAILRSYASGDAGPITERTTLGQSGASVVHLLVDGKKVTFDGNAWSESDPNLLVYDATFVSENVFTGDSIEQRHRRNLYEVVVGAGNVGIARRIAEIDRETRRLSNELAGTEQQIREHMQAPFDLAAFLALPKEPREAIEPQIAQKETLLLAARKAAEILARPAIAPIDAPEVPPGIEACLVKTFVALSEDASRRLAEHLRGLGSNAEEWVFRGTSHLHGDACPFCAQDIAGNALVRAYGEYFSAAYRDHQRDVHQLLNGVDRTFGVAAAHAVQQQVAVNVARIDKWRDLIELGFVVPPKDPAQILERVRAALHGALDAKLRAPNVPVQVGPEVAAALADLEQFAREVATYNSQVENANAQIAQTKKASASADVAGLEREIRRLKNVIVRHKPAVATLCTKYETARDAKAALTAEKDQLKQDLSQKTATLLQAYEQSINEVLHRFSATFRIAGSKPAYGGGKAASAYKIEINDCEVPVDAPPGRPGFRALSAGDRTSLALAFFVAQLRSDPMLADRTVVIDDPISSLDAFRATCTRHVVAEVGRAAKQLVVLSHDPQFLKGLYDASDKASVKCLEFRQKGTSTEVAEWNVHEAAKTKHHQDRAMLKRYLDGTANADSLSVARCVRPFLEGALRIRFPDDFKDAEWLGDFIAKVRVAPPGHALEGMQPDQSDLELVNDYTKVFHHEGITSGPEPVNDDELRMHVELALKLASGGATQ